MAGPPKIQPSVYGDIEQLAQLGIKNSPRENLPRLVDRTAGRPPTGRARPPRTRTPRSGGARRRAQLPSAVTSEMAQAFQKVGRAAKYLQIAQEAASQADAGPEVMKVLERAQYNYVRALYSAYQVTPTYDHTEDF